MEERERERERSSCLKWTKLFKEFKTLPFMYYSLNSYINNFFKVQINKVL